MAVVEEDDIDPKYGKLDKELVALLREYEVKYFREDKPVPFLPGLDIYPIPVRYFEEFANCSGCLSLNKNEEAKGVRMSHLEYLLDNISLCNISYAPPNNLAIDILSTPHSICRQITLKSISIK